MKTNCWLIFAVMVSGSLLAQTATNQPAAPAGAAAAVPAASEPAVAAPAAAVKPAPAKAPAKQTTRKAPVKKAAAKKPTYDLKTVPLAPGPATLVASNVNVRGQAKLKSEIVARLSKPQEVRVIEEIILKNSGADEPSAWARIELPAGIHVWVHKQYIDATTKAVKPRRLNVRSGPGENYSILGRIEKDAVVKEVSTKGDWIQIEAPAGAYAFVAAQYLQQGAAAIEVATTAPTSATEPKTTEVPVTEPPATPTTVTEPPVVAPAPGDLPPIVAVAPTNVPTATTEGTNEMATTVESTAPEPEEELPPRIVSREGIVRATTSIQAPTRFALVSPDTKRLMNYLYTTSPNLDLQRYKGIRIIVTGEESMDERWGNTPLITLQRIQVVPE